VRDSPPALGDEVLRCAPPTCVIVDIDVAGQECGARASAKDHRYPARLQTGKQRLRLVQGEEEHRVDVASREVLVQALDVRRGLRREQHHLESVGRQLLADRSEEPCQHRITEQL